MKNNIKEKIRNIVNLYEKVILFGENEGHFGAVFRAVIEKAGGHIITMESETNSWGGNYELKDCAVIVCSSNEIYAKESLKKLHETGYQNVFIPADFGIIYSPDKLNGLEFNLNIGCSLNCYYCPQKVLLNGYKKYGKEPCERHLTLENFQYIIEERMNPGAAVCFSGMSEPFENDDFFKMLLYASENGNKILLNTTLMGLKEVVLDEMIEKKIKIERCILHIPDNKGNSHFKLTDNYIKVFKKFILHYKKSFCYLTCHGDSPHETIKEVIKKNEIENIHYEDMMGARCGNLDTTIRELPPVRNGRLVCTMGAPFGKSPVCMPDGTLGLCCNDYALDTCIGNILDDEWGTIVSGKGYQEYLNALENENKEYICRHCGNAIKRNAAVRSICPDYFYWGDNFYQVKGLIEKGEHELAKRLQRAEHICIFGLGKFFKDNYFQAGWSSIIRADLLSDNNQELWGKEFGGIPIIPKQQLLSYQNLLVIVYTMMPDAIMADLHNIGICDVMPIIDIMNVFGGDGNV